MQIAITGANGHLGLKLIDRLQEAGDAVRALVRSERAAESVRGRFPQLDVRIVDYADSEGLRNASEGCDALIHLVGIIKESKANTFEQAHEAPCRALTEASLAVKHVIYLGIVGTHSGSTNACLQSRARAEALLRKSDVPVSILRVPMVLGPDDYASMSLARNGQKSLVFGFRTASLEQPIYSGDVVSAIFAATRLDAVNRTLDLAGPESLSRAQLIKRAGQCFDNEPGVVSVPVSLGYAMAFLFELVSSSPPVTRAMLGVLDHDDNIDNGPALRELGIELTPLDETLQAVLLPNA
jgi:uncharacterized protein YbjT (DUF2867 family)